MNSTNLWRVIKNKEGRYCRYPNGFALPEGWQYPPNEIIMYKGQFMPVYDNNGNLIPYLRNLEVYAGEHELIF